MVVVIAQKTIRGVARRLVARALDVEPIGLRHVPTAGPVLLAARHVHHLHDGAALLALVPRTLHVLVALDWVQGAAMRRVMEVATRAARWPVVLRADALATGPDGRPRNGGSAYRLDEEPRYRLRALRDSLALLVGGAALLVFPEAYPGVDPRFTPKRDPDELLPFRPGFAALVALAAQRRGVDVPVVPVGLEYRPGPRLRLVVRFGRPLRPGAQARQAGFVGAVERTVAALSGVPTADRATG